MKSFEKREKKKYISTDTNTDTIGTKCAPTNNCIFTDEVETEFLKIQERTPLVWFRYIDIFFIWTNGKDHLELFLQ